MDMSLMRRPLSLVLLLFLLVCFIWFMYPRINSKKLMTKARTYFKLDGYVDRFKNDVIKFKQFQEDCYGDDGPKTVSDLKTYSEKLNNGKSFCKEHYRLFRSIYFIYSRYATIAVSKSFLKKLHKWFPGREDLITATKNQTLIFINNLQTDEAVVFNTVRANRPVASTIEGDTLNYVNKLVNASANSCPFCSYADKTTTDSIGRMESKYTVITASRYKADTYHGLASLKRHHPLHFTQHEFIDCMDLIMQWFGKVQTASSSLLYRIVYWDILPKAGSAQVHPVLHATIGDSTYHARWNRLHRSSLEYSKKSGGLNYWSSLLQIHMLLGLSYSYGKASLMAYLNPQKDAEVMILCEKPSLDFFRLVFFTIRTFIDDMQLYALSMSIAFPKLNSDGDGRELPMVFRIVSRGSADSSRSDIGSFGFYGTVNVNRDPFKLIKQMRTSIRKRIDSKFTWRWNHG